MTRAGSGTYSVVWPAQGGKEKGALRCAGRKEFLCVGRDTKVMTFAALLDGASLALVWSYLLGAAEAVR